MSDIYNLFGDAITIEISESVNKAVGESVLKLRQEYKPDAFIVDVGEEICISCTDFYYDIVDEEREWNRFHLKDLLNVFVAEREHCINPRMTEESRKQYPELMEIRRILQETIEQIDGLRDLDYDN